MGETIEPLPCPFCGEAPVVWPKHPEVEGDAWADVVCDNERCPTFRDGHGHGVQVGDGEDVSDERGSDAYKAVAIARWNTRVADPHLSALQAELDELRKALEPFARVWDEQTRHEDLPPAADNRNAWGFNGANVTWGDFRIARQALSAHRGET